ncbi:hypothetical protein ABZ639_03950 [Saccharomonospora sp. NPDC006951]
MSAKKRLLGKETLGLSFGAMAGLALVGVPRVVAHDLALVGSAVNSVLVFVPLAVWLAVVLWRRVPNPFLTLTVIGVYYGVLLAVVHQILWTEAFEGDPPALGGNLAGALSGPMEALVLRGFAFLSSLGTGAAVGAATGLVAWLLAKAVPAFRPHSRT